MDGQEQLTHERFAENLDTIFELVTGEGQVFPVKLAEVSELKRTSRTERFSLLFESPLDYLIQQGLYTIKHERMGTFELFMVPVFREETCFVYEALFNRLVKQQ
jgi:hypothetical protein